MRLILINPGWLSPSEHKVGSEYSIVIRKHARNGGMLIVADLDHGFVLLRVDDNHLAALPHILRHFGTDLHIPGFNPETGKKKNLNIIQIFV